MNGINRYIGFLEEESNEESSGNDNEDSLDEDDKLNRFLSKVQNFQD